MRPLTTSMPKVMLKVANKPILEYAVEALRQVGIRDMIMVVGYKKENIMSYFQDGKKWDVRIRYATEKKQLGTTHAVAQAEGMVDGPFLVYPGDNIIDPEALSLFLEKTEKMESALLVVQSARPAKYGMVITSGDRISGIRRDVEPKIGNLISTGIYRFTPKIFKSIKAEGKRGVHALTDFTMARMEKGQPMGAVVAPGRWMDAVHPWDLIAACESALAKVETKLQGTVSQKATIRGPVSIGEGALIREGCYIQGPVIIGRGCEIGPHVVITPATAIGDNVRIDPYVKIEQSVIMDDVAIGPFSSINHSVIAPGVVIEGHFSTVVGSCDVRSVHGYQKVEMMGAVIGEDTHIGAQTATLPGAIVGANCSVEPFHRLSGNIQNGSKVV